MSLLFQTKIYQFPPQVKKKMQLFLRLLLLQGVLVESVGRPTQYPMGLGDQLVEGRMVLRSEAKIRLYELIDKRSP